MPRSCARKMQDKTSGQVKKPLIKENKVMARIKAGWSATDMRGVVTALVWRCGGVRVALGRRWYKVHIRSISRAY